MPTEPTAQRKPHPLDQYQSGPDTIWTRQKAAPPTMRVKTGKFGGINFKASCGRDGAIRLYARLKNLEIRTAEGSSELEMWGRNRDGVWQKIDYVVTVPGANPGPVKTAPEPIDSRLKVPSGADSTNDGKGDKDSPGDAPEPTDLSQ